MCLFVLGYPKICWQMITFHISRNFQIARGTTFQSAELHDATQASETLQQKCSQHLLGSPGSATSFESKNGESTAPGYFNRGNQIELS